MGSLPGSQEGEHVPGRRSDVQRPRGGEGQGKVARLYALGLIRRTVETRSPPNGDRSWSYFRKPFQLLGGVWVSGREGRVRVWFGGAEVKATRT